MSGRWDASVPLGSGSIPAGSYFVVLSLTEALGDLWALWQEGFRAEEKGQESFDLATENLYQ